MSEDSEREVKNYLFKLHGTRWQEEYEKLQKAVHTCHVCGAKRKPLLDCDACGMENNHLKSMDEFVEKMARKVKESEGRDA